MKILEKQYEWAIAADLHEKLQRRLEQVELRERPAFIAVEQAYQHVVAGPTGPMPLVFSQCRSEGAENLHPWPQTRCASAVPTGPYGRHRPSSLGHIEQFER